MNRICPFCGSKLSEKDLSCPVCGEKIKKDNTNNSISGNNSSSLNSHKKNRHKTKRQSSSNQFLSIIGSFALIAIIGAICYLLFLKPDSRNIGSNTSSGIIKSQEDPDHSDGDEDPDSNDSADREYGKYKLINTDYLTLRSSPTINSHDNSIMKIPADSEVTVLEFECNGYWKVEYDGKEGYILPTYLSPLDNAVKPDKIADYKIITDYVTLRDIPSTEGAAFMQITTGEVVTCYDIADNGFLLVQYQGQMGFILKNYNGEILVEKL